MPTLFGGAIELELPDRFEDISSYRDVPDNQEVRRSVLRVSHAFWSHGGFACEMPRRSRHAWFAQLVACSLHATSQIEQHELGFRICQLMSTCSTSVRLTILCYLKLRCSRMASWISRSSLRFWCVCTAAFPTFSCHPCTRVMSCRKLAYCIT